MARFVSLVQKTKVKYFSQLTDCNEVLNKRTADYVRLLQGPFSMRTTIIVVTQHKTFKIVKNTICTQRLSRAQNWVKEQHILSTKLYSYTIYLLSRQILFNWCHYVAVAFLKAFSALWTGYQVQFVM